MSPQGKPFNSLLVEAVDLSHSIVTILRDQGPASMSPTEAVKEILEQDQQAPFFQSLAKDDYSFDDLVNWFERKGPEADMALFPEEITIIGTFAFALVRSLERAAGGQNSRISKLSEAASLLKITIDEILTRIENQGGLEKDVADEFSRSQNPCIIINPGSAPPEAIAEYLLEISTLYRRVGGSGITFRRTESREIHASYT